MLWMVLGLSDGLAPGDPDERVQAVFREAWLPLLHKLDQNPRVKVAIHLSSRLGEWLLEQQPAALERLGALVRAGQVDALAGAWGGAALQLLPSRDALEQLRVHRRWLRTHLGARAAGGWLEAGAWDPSLPLLLSRAGLHYVMVDRSLIAAGGRARTLEGRWGIAERAGRGLGVLPVDFREGVGDAGAMIHQLRERLAWGWPLSGLTLSLDQALVAGDAEIESLIGTISAQSAWLKCEHGPALMERLAPSGRVYPAAGTPPCLGAALLPFSRGVEAAADSDADRGIAGPPVEAVLARHDAANRLHKTMLQVSALVHRLRRAQADPAQVERAQSLLHLAQSLAPLHDGPGGRRTDARVRHHAWSALLQAERISREALGTTGGLRQQQIDYDNDGRTEVLVTTPALKLVLRPSAGGGVSDLQVWGVGNLANTIARSREPWHRLLAQTLPVLVDDTDEVEAPAEALAEAPTEALRPVPLSDPEGPIVQVFDDEPDDLVVAGEALVDRHRRLLFQDHFLGEGTHLENLRRGQHPQLGDFLGADYRLRGVERQEDGGLVVRMERQGTVRRGRHHSLVRVAKCFGFGPSGAAFRVDYTVQNRSVEPVLGDFAVELDFCLAEGGPASHHLRVQGGAPRTWSEAARHEAITELSLRMGGRDVRLTMDPPARLFRYPIQVPSRTTRGIQMADQGISLLLAWDSSLWGQEKLECAIDVRIVEP